MKSSFDFLKDTNIQSSLDKIKSSLYDSANLIEQTSQAINNPDFSKIKAVIEATKEEEDKKYKNGFKIQWKIGAVGWIVTIVSSIISFILGMFFQKYCK